MHDAWCPKAPVPPSPVQHTPSSLLSVDVLHLDLALVIQHPAVGTAGRQTRLPRLLQDVVITPQAHLVCGWVPTGGGQDTSASGELRGSAFCRVGPSETHSVKSANTWPTQAGACCNLFSHPMIQAPLRLQLTSAIAISYATICEVQLCTAQGALCSLAILAMGHVSGRGGVAAPRQVKDNSG